MEDWAEVRRLRRAEGLAIQAVARRSGVSRNAVDGRWPVMNRRGIAGLPRDPLWTGAEPQIRALLAEFPSLPSTVIAERIGWTPG